MSNDKLAATLHDGNPIDPDCRDGKHRACLGETWDDVYDRPAECGCPCHSEP